MTWRWPWVSRHGFDEAHRLLTEAHVAQVRAETRASAAEERVRRAERQHDDLLSRYHMLRMSGANEPAPPREKPTPDLVKAAIARKCGRNKDLRRQMEAQVAADRAAGKSDAEIALSIEQGNTDAFV